MHPQEAGIRQLTVELGIDRRAPARRDAVRHAFDDRAQRGAGKPCLVLAHEDEVLGQLVVQEAGGLFADGQGEEVTPVLIVPW